MRIVSLLPAATEWLAFLDAVELLVGRSHECDYPEVVGDVPVVTGPAINTTGDSAQIDRAVRDRAQRGLSIYDVDIEKLRALEPDLILTQDQCDVCATSLSQVEEVLRDEVDREVDVFSMQPATLKEALTVPLNLGRRIGRAVEPMKKLSRHEAHLARLQRGLGVDPKNTPQDAPSVACIEWIQPVMTAGHWTPDLVRHAGGRAVLAEAGEASRWIQWDDLTASDPDVMAIMPCGFSLDDTRRDLHYLTEKTAWSDLSAVVNKRVFLFDGSAYFNRPGPRLYRAIELLMHALHPQSAKDLVQAPAAWEMQKTPR